MSKTMIKETDYKKYHFIISVDINTTIERTPNGKRYSRIIISNTTGYRTYYKNKQVETKNLKSELEAFEEDMIKFVDSDDEILSETEQMLVDLGFIK